MNCFYFSFPISHFYPPFPIALRGRRSEVTSQIPMTNGLFLFSIFHFSFFISHFHLPFPIYLRVSIFSVSLCGEGFTTETQSE